MTKTEREKQTDWRPQASASFWINRASKSLLRLQDQCLRPLGFAMAQMRVLHALADGGAWSQKALVRHAGVEQPTMAALLSRMERDHIIERHADPHDGRGSVASLTRLARSRLSSARTALAGAERAALVGFTTDEQALLLRLLQRIVDNIAAVESESRSADKRRRKQGRSS
jgi:MarR family transcriptional regulator, transcriptional regulator for hemolysin